MHEHGLAKELWPQLQQIAEQNEFTKVTRVEMIVGSLHGVSADFLAHSFVDHAFCGTKFEGAEMNVTVVDPEQEFVPPGQSDPIQAGGWELLISCMEGEK